MTQATHHKIIVVGTGFAGLGMAIRLRRQGLTDFVVLERAGDVGGTWRDNRYPGCACDVPSHLYSFSFVPNPSWSRSFSGQGEIWDYLRRCAERHRLHSHIRFHHEMLEATWLHAGRRWRVRTNRGEMTCDVLVTGTGALSEPAVPDIPGLGSFRGRVFHSGRWDADHDLAGRRVAVVGTGASAAQFVPRIQPEVAALTIFQRTPPWVLPRGDRDYGGARRWLYGRVPGLRRLARAANYWRRELSVPGFTSHPRLLKVAERMAHAQLRRQVTDPALREKLTPHYRLGCKRILLSNEYLPALTQPNVEVVASGLAEVGPDWVRAADGTRRRADTIIFGTGFQVSRMPMAPRVRGRDGRTLAEVWAHGGAQAHRGTTVSGFPNLFMLVGPNTGLGHSSLIYMIECQISYVLDGLRYLERTGLGAVEVTPEAQAAYNESIQSRMRRTVWNTGGCASWYLDDHGRNTTLWPTFTWRFRRATRTFRPDEYRHYAPTTQSASSLVQGGPVSLT